jgi:hypothetical protein
MSLVHNFMVLHPWKCAVLYALHSVQAWRRLWHHKNERLQ